MKRIVVLVIVLLHFVQQSETQGLQRCVPKPNCTECMKSPGCAWCNQMGFLKPEESNERRCDTEESLRSRHCDKEKHIINPEPKMDELKNNDLSQGPYDVIQIKPQNLKFKLRVGVPQTFKVSFKRAEGFPIDLYYLMDLSFSMRDDLDEIKHLGQDIVATLGNFTKKIRIGFGSFVDKVALPYVSQVKSKKKNPCPSRSTTCQPAFSFQNILSLTENAGDFKKEVSRQAISGNLDSPEGGFDAIMQAAVCQDVIRWHNVTRILVYTSDDTFHIAGDGRLAGIYEPHDGKCHLNGNNTYDGTKYDYPSIGHLSRVLAANNIQLIFAVTEETVPAYQALSKLIPQSVVGVLKKDSSNVVQLISEAYNNLSSTILLEHQGAPQGLDVAYKSHCVDSAPWRKSGECMNIKIDEQVDFTVRLNISECLGKEREFHFKVQGISETLKVAVETLCDCDCGEREESSPHCNNSGTLNCGVCSCDSGFVGQKCECEQQKGVASLDTSCRQNNASQVCSGHGHCHCGVCTCQISHSGTFCQCDDNNCPRNYNMLCGGNGNCNCSTCTCWANYTGSACECSMLTDECETEGNRHCSGHGQCECNRCHCNQDFTGKHCSSIVNTCQNYKKCIECISEHKGSGEEVMRCSKDPPCHSAKFHYIEQEELPCSTDALMYEVKPSPDGSILVRYTDLPRSIDRTFVIIVSSVSGIIVIGIAMILVCRLLLELHYRSEYRSFINAQKDSKWNEANNPLFQDATTTTVNPMHFEDD